MVLRTVLCTELAPKKCSFLFWVKVYWCRFCGISKVKRRVRLDLIRMRRWVSGVQNRIQVEEPDLGSPARRVYGRGGGNGRERQI